MLGAIAADRRHQLVVIALGGGLAAEPEAGGGAVFHRHQLSEVAWGACDAEEGVGLPFAHGDLLGAHGVVIGQVGQPGLAGIGETPVAGIAPWHRSAGRLWGHFKDLGDVGIPLAWRWCVYVHLCRALGGAWRNQLSPAKKYIVSTGGTNLRSNGHWHVIHANCSCNLEQGGVLGENIKIPGGVRAVS